MVIVREVLWTPLLGSHVWQLWWKAEFQSSIKYILIYIDILKHSFKHYFDNPKQKKSKVSNYSLRHTKTPSLSFKKVYEKNLNFRKSPFPTAKKSSRGIRLSNDAVREPWVMRNIIYKVDSFKCGINAENVLIFSS